MATSATATEPPAPSLWQAPVFVLGVAALAAAWLGKPLLGVSPTSRLDRDLAVARQELARPSGDLEQALKHARRAFEAAEALQDRQGEAALLVGTAHMRLAEAVSDPARAAEAWQRAWQYLNQADRAGVPDDDQSKLIYRLGKVGFLIGDELDRAIARLEEATPRGDSRAEGYRLLTEAHLRKQPPDLKRALEANERLRDLAEVETTESEYAAAMLQGGELLMRLRQYDRARLTLKRIGERAPPDILVRSRLLRARGYQDEKKWADAATLYQKALGDPRAPAPDPGVIHYNLGLCYRQLDQPTEAARAWQDCLRTARGPEAAAAAIALAELRLRQPALDAAVEALELAVAQVKIPGEWKNPLVGAEQAREVFESALTALRDNKRYDLALKAVQAYARLAAGRRVLELRGELSAEWARLKKEEARTTRAAGPLEAEARELFRKAGDAFAEAANLPQLAAADQGKYVWAAATNLLAAGAVEPAVERLNQLVALPGVEPAVLGEAWFRLAEAHRAAGEAVGAKNAYVECLRHETRFAYLARYQLALGHLEAGDVDEAMMALVLNIKMLRWESEPEALARSQLTLGNLLYQRRDYNGVIRYLDDALSRFKDSPQLKDALEMTQARFQLADAYRQNAARQTQSLLLGEKMSPERRKHYEAEQRRSLEDAAKLFAALDEYLETDAGREHLSAEQRTRVPFITAKCWFNLGDRDKALRLYERLIDRHAGKAEGLDALGGAVACHAAVGDVAKVRQRLLQIRTALPSLPADVREPWAAWVEEASKGLDGDLGPSH